MTTIAFKSGLMACDSCHSTAGGLIVISNIKIQRLASGALLGGAGDGDDRAVVELLDAIKNPVNLPSRKDLEATRTDYTGLLVFPNGRVFQIDIEQPKDKQDFVAAVEEIIGRNFAAVGSGHEIAIGAMAAGASAADAVAIACDWDTGSRLPVHVVGLAPPKNSVASQKNGRRHTQRARPDRGDVSSILARR